MKRRTKIFIGIILALSITVCLAIVYSPYGKHRGYDYKLIETYVDIDVPADSVFKYLGNSDNAQDWSVYVDHITPLNNDSFPDGAVGARRRCFRNPDEKGIWWDELITSVEPGKLRQLTIYNMHEFPMSAKGLATEQFYESYDGGNKCRLIFRVFFLHHDPGLWDELKTYLGAYTISNVFNENLANIKHLTEKKYAEAR
ncbi:MAG: hypothetical protein M3R17_06020 [Bacteroidota bacterium]|nr:hypothetical protein [Bacteroidota bacterium]